MKYNKLVRDKIPEILDSKGIKYEKRVVDKDEYISELIKKLKEEVDEFLQDGSIEELSDVLEVIKALENTDKYSNLEEVRVNKKEEKGGFERGYICKGEK